MNIFIRADGGENIGLGHIMRMLVLADELRKSNEVFFVCINKKEFMPGIELIKINNYKVILIREENTLLDIVKYAKEYEAHMLITDSYAVDEYYFDFLKQHFAVTGYIDDINKCRMNVDFIINQNINAKDMKYKGVKNLFLGPDYCMLRKEFRNRKTAKVNKKVENILLTLGGMDDEYNTVKLLNILVKTDINIHITIGKAYKDELINSLRIFEKNNSKVHLHENANMSELMLNSDIAITGCGSTLYELAAMNVPAIGIVLAENQREVARKMKDENIIYDFFDVKEVDEEDLLIKINELINNYEIRNGIVKSQKNIVNPLGIYKLVNKIEEKFINN